MILKNYQFIYNIFDNLLLRGYTSGITKEEYINISNSFVLSYNSKYKNKISIPVENFDEIIKSDNYCLVYQNSMIFPSYKYKFDNNKMPLSRMKSKILDTSLKCVIGEKNDYSTNINYNTKAVKISAFITEMLVKKYVEKAITDGLWAIQCKNIEKFVYINNYGQAANLPLTPNLINNFYNDAITRISQIIDENNTLGRDTIISNCVNDVLAYAFFLRIIKEYDLFYDLDYTGLKQFDQKINIITNNDNKIIKNLGEMINVYDEGDYAFDYFVEEKNITSYYVRSLNKKLEKSSIL